jgi:tetratricopeptide (TPR) repeat protein
MNLHELSQSLVVAGKDGSNTECQIIVSMGEILQNDGFISGALHAFAMAKRRAAACNASQGHMNATAAFIMQQVRAGHAVSAESKVELQRVCQKVGGTEGSWALCVVASKCYLASKMHLAFDLFAHALLLDHQNNSRASKIAWTYSGDILCAAAGKRLNNSSLSQAERWNKAESFYTAALALDPTFVDAKTSLAELLRKRGDLRAALQEFESIYVCLSPVATTTATTTEDSNESLDLIFNHAQCLECMCRYEESFALLVHHAEKAISYLPPAGDSVRIAEHAIVLLYIKLRFVSGKLSDKIYELPVLCENVRLTSWGKLVTLAQNWSIDVEKNIRKKLPTHWAYAYFLRQLWIIENDDQTSIVMPSGAKYSNLHVQHQPWIPIVGDSHCLSLAWTTIAGATIVPFVATGLKAWHMQPGSQFVTVSNLTAIFERLSGIKTNQESLQDCLFCAGEIDCREGIPDAVAKGKQATTKDAVQSTVKKLIDTLVSKSVAYGLRFYVLSVPPPFRFDTAAPSEQLLLRSHTVRIFNQELRDQIDQQCTSSTVRFLDIEDACSTTEHYFLKGELNADGTHANRKILPLVSESFNTFNRSK